MYIIGANPYQGLFTKAQRNQGKGATPGTRASLVASTGETKEFVAVKLSAATWVNGIAVIVDGLTAAVGAAVATASGLPADTLNSRLGVLVFGSATATQTMAGTAFGWAQIYGTVLAWCSGTITVGGQMLAVGASGQLIPAIRQVSGSNQVLGMTAVGTLSASTPTNSMIAVFLAYPHFAGMPDANLA